MPTVGFEMLQTQFESVQLARWVGRVVEIGRGTIQVSGLSEVAPLGAVVSIRSNGNPPVLGEIIRLDGETATVFPDGTMTGLCVNDRVELLGEDVIAPHESWIGRVIDPFGRAISGPPLLRGANARPLQGEPINPASRRGLGPRLATGTAVFDTVLPIVRGQRIGLFSGSGVGKSTLLGRLAIGLQTDIVVVAMIGERGREVREFVERVLGPTGMSRAIVVAATSDQSALVRRRCAWTAMAVAEHFRDEGRQVLFLADSLTRFAQAHQEIALAAGEAGSLRGYPPSVAHLIMKLCERAGPGTAQSADITAIFSVLVAGSNMEEPIADIVRGVLDGHVILDRKIAERGRFPAIDLLRSVSRSLPDAATEAENRLIARARELLGAYERNEMLIQAGLYSLGSDAMIDAAIAAWPRLDAFISERSGDFSESFAKLKACIEDIPPRNSEEIG